jgi:arsenite oxidase small subunit
MSEKDKKTFTAKDLEEYDGTNGKPQYLPFKGKVYDISDSKLWVNGLHLGGQHTLKENLDETMEDSPHGERVLQRFPVIGEIVKSEEEKAVEKITKITTEVPAPTPQITTTRRGFFKWAAVSGAAAVAISFINSLKILFFIPAQKAQTEWPKYKIVNINDLKTNVAVNFNYPLDNTPNYLVKCNEKAENGIGPDGDIVAFSAICQHLGCIYKFIPPESSPPCNPNYKENFDTGYCCCHGSQYDYLEGGKVIGGPAPHPVPQVKLELDSNTGDIYAVEMGPPTIFGHGPSGTSQPDLLLKYDLQGGTIVS